MALNTHHKALGNLALKFREFEALVVSFGHCFGKIGTVSPNRSRKLEIWI